MNIHPIKNEETKHCIPGWAQIPIPVENWGEGVNSATSLWVQAWGRTVPTTALAVLSWWILSTFIAFHFYCWTTSPCSTYLAYLKQKVFFFFSILMEHIIMGILRCEPSKVFWFLISRRFNNSNACEGLGLTNPQRLCTHCMAPNHNGFLELWACVLTLRDVLFCYNCSWVQNTFNKGVGTVHTWHGQRGTRNYSTGGFCLWHFDYDPASTAQATTLPGEQGKHMVKHPAFILPVAVLAWP